MVRNCSWLWLKAVHESLLLDFLRYFGTRNVYQLQGLYFERRRSWVYHSNAWKDCAVWLRVNH